MTAGPRGLSDAATVSIATIKSASQPALGSMLGNADYLALNPLKVWTVLLFCP